MPIDNLMYPQAVSKLILQTDASVLATGAALMQVSQGKLQPLASISGN